MLNKNTGPAFEQNNKNNENRDSSHFSLRGRRVKGVGVGGEKTRENQSRVILNFSLFFGPIPPSAKVSSQILTATAEQVNLYSIIIYLIYLLIDWLIDLINYILFNTNVPVSYSNQPHPSPPPTPLFSLSL